MYGSNSTAALACAAILAAACTCEAATPNSAADVRRLTGARTKIVWLRARNVQNRSMDGGAGFAVMALDSDERSGERELVPEATNYNPLVAPSGDEVVYTAGDKQDAVVKAVSWDGKNTRKIASGYGLWVWREPSTAHDWVFVSNDREHAGSVERRRLDDPSVVVKVYDGRLSNRFSISGDGSRAVGEFPHPDSAMFYASTKQIDRKDYQQGCNTYIAPDDSYRVTIMTGSHDIVRLYRRDSSVVDISVIPPGMKNCSDNRKGVVWNPKWVSDARHMIVAGPFRNLGPDWGDVWIGKFADDFNSISQWVQVTNSENMDVYAFAWVDPGLGRFKGEAPYEVRVPSSAMPGTGWRLDFGDRLGSTSAKGAHKFTRPGKYKIRASKDRQTIEGTVEVLPAKKPELLSTKALSSTDVLLTFSEAVRIEGATVSNTSGRKAAELILDSEGTGIIARFAGPLRRSEKLTASNVSDTAQKANTLLRASAQVTRSDWPSDRSGIGFIWGTARSDNTILDHRYGLPVNCSLSKGSNSRFNRFGVAATDGSSFKPSPGAGQRVIEGVQKTHEFSFEITVQTDDLEQTSGDIDGPITIVGWCYDWRNGTFWLSQEKRELRVALTKTWGDPDPRTFTVGRLEDTKPHHVVVALKKGRMACYVDGKMTSSLDPSPYFLFELSPPLNFGEFGWRQKQKRWRGRFEGVAMYSRFIEQEEAATNAAAYRKILAARKALPQIEIEGQLIASSQLPSRDDMGPYRHSLMVCEYRVLKVLKGRYTPRKIRVVHWGLRDYEQADSAKRKPGDRATMTVESFADHDELEPELIADTLEEDFDLDLFTDVNTD